MSADADPAQAFDGAQFDEFYDRAFVQPVLPLVLWGKRREVMRKGRVYLPYFSYRAQFDTTETRAAVDPHGYRVPHVREYFEKLIDYALATEWGRKDPHVPMTTGPLRG